MHSTNRPTRMRYLRLQYNVEAKEVARELGISTGYLSKLERGWFRKVPYYLAENILEFYGEGFDSLMEEVQLPKIGDVKNIQRLSVGA